MLGERSLSCTHGGDHLKLRKLLNPAFAPGRITEYLPDMVDLCQESIDYWLKLGHFNAKLEINAFTFKVSTAVAVSRPRPLLPSSAALGAGCGLADDACVQVAAKVILGFNDSWLEESKLRSVQKAFGTYTTALFNFLPKFMVHVPGNSKPLAP